jgi:P pilus assembly chaperone PapD
MRHRILAAPRVAAGAVLVAVLLPAVIEAVYVSPTAVFMDERTPSAQVTIGNAGDTPEEATVEIRFGFPDADSAGTPFVRMVDDPDSTYPSAADWIRAFPQRVLLQPRSQQIVRLLARPPAGLPAGEYWARLIVTGQGATQRVATEDTVVRAGLNLVIRLVASVNFRNGQVSTGVAVQDMTAEAEGDSLTVWTHLERRGNAAYLGTADVDLVNQAGSVVRSWSSTLAVYVPMRRRFSFPLDSIAPGDYRVRLRLHADRPDLPTERVLRAPAVADSAVVRVG